MELNHLRYFYEVARQGSFTKAAARLRVAQPAISRIIKTLEEREGVRLLERGKRGASLTDEGRLFFESCRSIFTEIDALETAVKARRRDCAGSLRVGASDHLCNYVFPALFMEFWKRYPRVRINLMNGGSEAIKAELLEGRAELGLFHSTPRERELSAEEIARIGFAVVFSPRNELLMSASRFTPGPLERAYYIGCRQADYRRTNPTAAMLEGLGVRPRLFFETNSLETQKRMALQEYGYAVLPRYMVATELKAGLLREYPLPRAIGSPLYLVTKRGREPGRPAAVFRDFLKSRVGARVSGPAI